jgi:hypothetical protein
LRAKCLVRQQAYCGALEPQICTVIAMNNETRLPRARARRLTIDNLFVGLRPEAPNRLSSDTLHPLVYKVMPGLALWVVLAAWGFFADRGYIFLALSVVTWLVTVGVVLPTALAWIGRRDPRRGRQSASFRDWVHGDFALSEERIKGSLAATQIFLPLMAVAIGMTLFAIVRDIVVG